MKLRYKKSGEETESYKFNTSALAEIDVGDDSVYIKDLDVFVNGAWKDMRQAFRDRDIIPDNYNQYFAEPRTPEEKAQGYYD